MSVPLTLGLPHRPEPDALVSGLLQQRCRSIDEIATRHDAVTSGPPVVAASLVTRAAEAADLGRVVIELDIDPSELRRRRAITYESVRFHVDADQDTLGEATALRVPSPLVVFVPSDGPSPMDAVTEIVEAHRTPGVDASAPPRFIADVLAVVAHAEVGFCARANSGSEVLAILAATVAALRGDDIPAALAEPDTGALASLRPEAADAVRSVLLGIEVADAAEAHAALHDAGLI